MSYGLGKSLLSWGGVEEEKEEEERGGGRALGWRRESTWQARLDHHSAIPCMTTRDFRILVLLFSPVTATPNVCLPSMLGDFSEWKCVCFASMSPQPAPNTVILPSSVSDFVHIRDNELPWSRNRFYSLLRFTLFSTLFVIF